MKFRQFLTDDGAPLAEGDLLAAPSTGASTTDPSKATLSKTQWSNPSQGSQAAGDSQSPENGGMPHGSGRPPDTMDGQLKKAAAMASELLKILTTMPRPWNRRFGPFIRALRGLLDKLSQVS
jgi:hypothetical protein